MAENTSDQPLKFIICVPDSKKPTALKTFLSQFQEPSLTLVPVSQASEIYPQIQNEMGSIVLMSVATKEDIAATLQLLAQLESKPTHKVLAFSFLNNDKVVQLLRAKGIFDVFEPAVSLKAFHYKYNKCFAVFQSAVKRAKINLKNTGAGLGAKGGINQEAQTGEVVWLDPVEHFSDFWLLMNPKHVRFVIGKWFINFYGPGPSCGEWEKFSETRNGEQGWIFNPRDQSDQRFYKNNGRWVFFGNCPEFSWEEKHWYFISKKPELSFYQDQKIIHSKVLVKENGNLELLNNSRTGTAMKDLIAESIEASILLDGSQKEKLENAEIEQDKLKTLAQHRVNTDKLREYRGQFSEEFAEKKKRYAAFYDDSTLKIGITAKNGLAFMQNVLVDLVELREKYVVLGVPVGLVMVDDQIELEATLEQNGETRKIPFSASTQIVETESDVAQDSKRQRSVAICELNDKIAPQFIELIQLYKNRRAEMIEFFAMAKGVEV